jgi:kumamolisin
MSRIARGFFASVPLTSALLLVVLFALCVPDARAQETQDDGPTAAAQPITVSLVLKVRHPDLLEAFVASSQDPYSPLFHNFLSLREFTAAFSPSPSDIATITKYLQGFNIAVTDVYADRLVIKATGTADAFDQAFSVDMHDYTRGHKRFHRPRHAPRIPLLLKDLLVAVSGLSNESLFHPMHRNAAAAQTPLRVPSPKLPPAGAVATGVPGDFTVGDTANLYNINPLYKAHIDGRGRTVGIATLANFIPADAFTYWSLIGLNVNQNRITQVHVDGGGELSADAGSGETSLDVEQSGGLAPAAKIIVYDAPNTDAGFIDLFYKAASDNLVDSLSVSWGLAEPYYYEAVSGTDRTPQFLAFHQAFLEAAAQGISLFAASGDSGAYDANDAFNDPVFNVLSVDFPSADPAITAGGGTTTPIILTAGPGTPDLVVPTEQVWGWDYIQDYLVAVFGPDFENSQFPGGGGGGVSIFWPRPAYQSGTNGIRRTEPGQSVIFDDGSGSGPQDLLDLPARFAGRNLPDVSLNADPFSGYLLYSTSDGGLLDGFGGTSFVAPQLNGISALLEQAVGGRIGLWNPMLYRYKKLYGHSGSSPLVDITAGDNWFYKGIPGYEPGAGLGVLDVTNLAQALLRESRH